MEFSISPEQRIDSSGDDASADTNRKSHIRTHRPSNQAEYVMDRTEVDEDPDNKRAKETKQERFERLQDYYNKAYLVLLKDSTHDSIDPTALDRSSTQIGVVKWSSTEIETFFRALAVKGKVDVKGIAEVIGSKSEVEVYDYICILQGEAKLRQRLSPNSGKPTLEDIPAAAELSNGCVESLEEVADSLVAQQDRYDQAVGEQHHGWRWLIDHAKAVHLDEIMDGVEEGNQELLDKCPEGENRDHSADDVASLVPARGLFRLSPWLKLTERFFMNSGEAGQPNNWLTHAARDEEPALRNDAIEDFYDQTVFHLRKLVQSTIFCAKDRLKSLKESGYGPASSITRQDVVSAFSLLDVPQDRSDFWLKLARRNRLRVVDHPRRKAEIRGVPLSIDEVERSLSTTQRTARRGRSSAPSTYDTSPEESEESQSRDGRPAHDDATSTPSVTGGPCQHSCQCSVPDASSGHEEVDAHMEFPNSSESPTGLDISSDDEAEKAMEEADESLAEMDQITSRRHELQLYEDLQWPIPESSSTNVDEGSARIGKKRVRAKEDHPDWRYGTTPYTESWIMLNDFEETQHKSQKRAKLTRQELAFRDAQVKMKE